MIVPQRNGPGQQTIWPGERPSLCSLLKWMASDTYDWLRDGYGQHAPPPGEETFTDVHIRHLRKAMEGRLKIIQFTKQQESFNGADWELWIHNRSYGLGLRIQAKKESRTGQYGFDYWLDERSALQCDLLIHDALTVQCMPVYLLYNHEPWPIRPDVAKSLCSHTAPDASHYGCSLLSAFHVQAPLFRKAVDWKLRKVFRNIPHKRLREISLPWNQVLCDVKAPTGAWDSRGVAMLKAVQKRTAAMERSGLAALGDVERGEFLTPSHAWGGTPEVMTWTDGELPEEDGEPVLRPLPRRVLGLLEADSLHAPEPEVPTRAMVLYDVSEGAEVARRDLGCLQYE